MNTPPPTDLLGLPMAAIGEVLAAMPAPLGGGQVGHLEAELATRFGARHAVAVSSGTAALHCALAALRIGAGDEVILPAVSVVMSAAPVVHAGARPVFADCDATGADFDYGDLASKVTARTRAVMPVYLWGRAADPARLEDFAARHGLRIIEDACQAHGSRARGASLGTIGDLGCFSLKDGKILWAGEGGFILTGDGALAERCRAVRTHWQVPAAGQAAMTEIGHNYRLTEVQAVIARWNLARFDDLLRRRRAQTTRLTAALAGIPEIRWHAPREWEEWNGFSPVATLSLLRPREFTRHLAEAGVPNSAGSFGLIANDQRPLFSRQASCPRAATFLDSALAIVLSEHDSEQDIDTTAARIAKEICQWA
jgi:dTDP-4-amino-4,6-dideoxygalactose transaminase